MKRHGDEGDSYRAEDGNREGCAFGEEEGGVGEGPAVVRFAEECAGLAEVSEVGAEGGVGVEQADDDVGVGEGVNGEGDPPCREGNGEALSGGLAAEQGHDGDDGEGDGGGEDHAEGEAADDGGDNPPAGDAGLDVLECSEDGKEDEDAAGEVGFDLVCAVDDDGHEGEAGARGGGEDPPAKETPAQAVDRPDSHESPGGAVEAGNDVKAGEVFGVVEVPGEVG